MSPPGRRLLALGLLVVAAALATSPAGAGRLHPATNAAESTWPARLDSAQTNSTHSQLSRGRQLVGVLGHSHIHQQLLDMDKVDSLVGEAARRFQTEAAALGAQLRRKWFLPGRRSRGESPLQACNIREQDTSVSQVWTTHTVPRWAVE